MNEFNWVRARAKCSLAQIFEQLRLEVQEDIEERQAMRGKDEIMGGYSHGFSFSGTSTKFSASLRGHQTPPHSIIFALCKDKIEVRDETDHLLLQFSVTLNGEGRCVAKVGSQEFEFWQIRLKTLESLFFEGDIPINIPA
jgi:hypothetical protein